MATSPKLFLWATETSENSLTDYCSLHKFGHTEFWAESQQKRSIVQLIESASTQIQVQMRLALAQIDNYHTTLTAKTDTSWLHNKGGKNWTGQKGLRAQIERKSSQKSRKISWFTSLKMKTSKVFKYKSKMINRSETWRLTLKAIPVEQSISLALLRRIAISGRQRNKKVLKSIIRLKEYQSLRKILSWEIWNSSSFTIPYSSLRRLLESRRLAIHLVLIG